MTDPFTPEQRVEVDKIISILVYQAVGTINQSALRIELMDTRPNSSYDVLNTEDNPNKHKFRYVAQGMLEDLIVRLTEKV